MKLLKFFAQWCGPCKQQTKHFEENPLTIPVISIDIDEDEKDLASQYKVMSIPTLVLIDDTNAEEAEIKRWVGFTTSETINEFINGRKEATD